MPYYNIPSITTDSSSSTNGYIYIGDPIWKTTIDELWERNKTIVLNNLKEDESMEHLYEVYLIDKERKIHINQITVAKNEEEAKFNAGVYEWLKLYGKKLSDVTVIVKSVGQVKVEDENN